MPQPVDNLRSYLEGFWHLDREIRDARLGITGHLQGCGCFEPAPFGLFFTTTGELRYGAFHGKASQRYRYVMPDTTCLSFAQVQFEDGRPFFDLTIRSGECIVSHHCGRDIYHGTFTTHSIARFDVNWHVDGPVKDLSIHSRYCRQANA